MVPATSAFSTEAPGSPVKPKKAERHWSIALETRCGISADGRRCVFRAAAVPNNPVDPTSHTLFANALPSKKPKMNH